MFLMFLPARLFDINQSRRFLDYIAKIKKIDVAGYIANAAAPEPPKNPP